MKTEEAYQTYLVQANNEAQFQSTILWLLFIIFVVGPLLFLFCYILYRLLSNRKCPSCNGKNTGPAMLVKTKKGVTTSRKVLICSDCGNEF